MNKTNFQHGMVVTPGFLNAINQAVCKKDPQVDGEIQSPPFDQLQDASWLTRVILEELFIDLGLRPADHVADALNGASLAAFVRLFGVNSSERSTYISKLIGFVNSLHGDPSDFVMQISQHIDALTLSQSNAALKIETLEESVSRRDRWMLNDDNALIRFANFSSNITETTALPSSRALIQTAPGNSGYYFNACFKSPPRKSTGVGAASIILSDNTSSDSFFSNFLNDLWAARLSEFPVINFSVEYPVFAKAGLSLSVDVDYISFGPDFNASELAFNLYDQAGRVVQVENLLLPDYSCTFKISMFVPTPH